MSFYSFDQFHLKSYSSNPGINRKQLNSSPIILKSRSGRRVGPRSGGEKNSTRVRTAGGLESGVWTLRWRWRLSSASSLSTLDSRRIWIATVKQIEDEVQKKLNSC